MYQCDTCGCQFAQPAILHERHGMEGAPYEELPVCPNCREHFFVRMVKCDWCGEYTAQRYVKTAGGTVFCENCYTIKEPEW